MSKAEYYWKSQLKERGWTDSAIKKFLGNPDSERKNPHYRSAPPMLLWECDRVHVVEESDDFQEWLNKSKPRREQASARMKLVMQEKRSEAIEEFTQKIKRSLDGCLDDYSIDDLEHAAKLNWMENKQNFLNDRGRYNETVDYPKDADPDTVRRWVENFVRHCLSDYEYLLREMHGQIGRAEAYDAVKVEVSGFVEDFYITKLQRVQLQP